VARLHDGRVEAGAGDEREGAVADEAQVDASTPAVDGHVHGASSARGMPRFCATWLAVPRGMIASGVVPARPVAASASVPSPPHTATAR
jgi:hypothetical protein